jgi:uncharacterized protein (DUF1697 family)
MSKPTRYAAFLRGVNLGPRRKVSSSELREHFEALGFEDVATFRTSGNVVFEADQKPEARLREGIEQRLASELGFEITVFLRTASQLAAIAEHEPFARRAVETSKGKLQVLLLPARPAAGKRDQVLALATDEDRLAFGDAELYWLPSGGIRDSTLDLKGIEKAIGPTTTRTKGTIENLAAKFFAD